MLEIAHLLLSILRASTPGRAHVAKYSSLAEPDGTQVSRLLLTMEWNIQGEYMAAEASSHTLQPSPEHPVSAELTI